jgi:hypothetical protein
MTNENLGRNIDQEETDDTEVLIDEKRSQSGSASMVIAIIWFLIGGVLGLALTVNYYDEIIAFIQSV